MSEAQAQPTDVTPPNPLRLWDRTIRRRARDVARNQLFRPLPPVPGVIGIVVAHDPERGVDVLYEDGRQDCISPAEFIEIPYGAPQTIQIDGPGPA
jgi:hypothetical protein